MTGPIDPHEARSPRRPRSCAGHRQHDPGELGALALGLLDPAAPARSRSTWRRARPAAATWRT